MKDVIIKLEHGSYFVLFAERKRGQRHAAAMFDARDCGLERVVKWIKESGKYRLIEEVTA